MAKLPTTLYVSQLPQENTFEALPEGKYIAVLKTAELKLNSANTGQILKIKFQVVDGQYKGSSFFEMLNISNPNEKTVEIALARLSTILQLGGMQSLDDTDDLVRGNIRVLATLATEIYNGEKRNKVVKMESPQNTQPTPTQSYIAQPPVTPATFGFGQQPQNPASWQQQPQTPQQGQNPDVNQFMQVNSTLGQQPQQATWGQPQQPQAPQQTTAQYLDDSVDVPF